MASCGTVEILPQFNQSSVQVVSCDLSDTQIRVGESVTATATVENANATGATAEVRFTSGSESVGRTLSIPAESTRTAEATFTYPEPNTFDVAVELRSAQRG